MRFTGKKKNYNKFKNGLQKGKKKRKRNNVEGLLFVFPFEVESGAFDEIWKELRIGTKLIQNLHDEIKTSRKKKCEQLTGRGISMIEITEADAKLTSAGIWFNDSLIDLWMCW